MEHSVYYFHSDVVKKIFAFARDDEIIKINVKYIEDYNGDGETIDKFNFVISLKQLKSCKKLYEYYMLSKLLTKNIDDLIYSKDSSGQDEGWRSSFRKNWNGKYFTSEYYNDFRFVSYAENFMIDDSENINSHIEHIETKEKDEPNFLTKYLETA